MSPIMANLLLFGAVYWLLVGAICWLVVKAFR
jgi:hypothetical protein